MSPPRSPAPQGPTSFEILLVTLPGLEPYLLDEVSAAGFMRPKAISGGVLIWGGWKDVWRANLTLRGASKVLARIGSFRAFHLAQLDKRARKFPWAQILTPNHKIKAEVVTNRKSKIYHAGAAVERIERAIHEELGAPIAKGLDDADIIIKARIDDNNVQLSVDTSGTALHKRGHKQAMGKAPMRETMAAAFLHACEYDGVEPVIDPMCGSGTFLIEAAEISQGMMAGRARSFAFEKFSSFDASSFDKQRERWAKDLRKTLPETSGKAGPRFYGSDRNVNVIGFAQANAKRAGVAALCQFTPTQVSALTRPDAEAGLVMVNPPYGARVGKKNDLPALYAGFGHVMREQFKGWRVGLVTTDTKLAEATGLPWLPSGTPIAHGGLKVRLFRTGVL